MDQKMEALHKTHDDFQKVIENDDSNIMAEDVTVTVTIESPKTTRQRLEACINSNPFMGAIIMLVVLDSLLVIAELLLDVALLNNWNEYSIAHQIFQNISLIILIIFAIEIGIRVYVMRMSFFKNKLEVFDSFIVLVSITLDIIFHGTHATPGVGLVILLRLWRVTRIVNGIVKSAQRNAESKVEKERIRFRLCEKQLKKYYTKCMLQEKEIARLNQILIKYNFDSLTSDVDL
uniref:Voltage-gated hydrogen channel 1 n=2 Tax=Arion vulgaris TaxID=1028688 RepID=A0A0B7ACM0_9EUPU